MANNSVTILETMVNSFTNTDELMDFAVTWGLQDSLAVRYKLFQMNTQYDETFVNEQLESLLQTFGAGQRSAVGNASGYRCVSDCRSRGREFDPGPVPYFRGD